MTALSSLSKSQGARLARLYRDAENEIIRALDKARRRGNDTTHLEAIRAQVEGILKDLAEQSHKWVSEAVPRAYESGLEAAESQLSGAGIAVAGDFSGIHTQAAQVLADNAYSKLSDVVTVVGRRTEGALRDIALEQIKGGVFGIENTQQVTKGLLDSFTENGITGFVDVRGREWAMDTYAEMVARTTMAETMRAGTELRLGEAGVTMFVVVGGEDERTCDICAEAVEGGPYTQEEIDELTDRGLFHPNCTHDIAADPTELEEIANEGEKEAGQSEGETSDEEASGSSIPLPEPDGSGYMPDDTQLEREARLWSYTEEEGREYGYVENMYGDSREIRGSDSSVTFDTHDLNGAELVVHTHPPGEDYYHTFSTADVASQLEAGSIVERVVAPQGTYMIDFTGMESSQITEAANAWAKSELDRPYVTDRMLDRVAKEFMLQDAIDGKFAERSSYDALNGAYERLWSELIPALGGRFTFEPRV